MNSLRQSKQLELNLKFSGTVVHLDYSSEEFVASYLSESPTGQIRLMESICERSNMKRAIRRVVKNKGAPGVDGMTVRQVKRYLKRHWPKIEQALLDGTYMPMPVRRKEIAKPGGVRLLGIPTALDRVIQQATAQVLAQIWDYTFPFYRICSFIMCLISGWSGIFRKTHGHAMPMMLWPTVKQGRKPKPYWKSCIRVLMNVALSYFRIKRGLFTARTVIAGGDYPEIKFDSFVVGSTTAVVFTNQPCILFSVGRPWERKYLGFCMTNSRKNPKIRIHWKTIKRFKERVREITARRRGRSILQVICELNRFMKG